MAVDCLHEPVILAFGKAFGASLGIFAAALAWLVNNLVKWIVWRFGERRGEYDLIKALKAEIASNGVSEASWADCGLRDRLLSEFETDPGQDKSWTPYVAVIEGNAVFDSVKGAISRFPAEVIEPLVTYYNLTTGMTRQLADFRSDAYATLSRSRQKRVIRQIFVLGQQVRESASNADRALTSRLFALRAGDHIFLGLLVVLCAGATLLALSGANASATRFVTPAVEWASSCDLAPHTGPQ